MTFIIFLKFTIPPYIHTPEGLAYPYAPPIAFMETSYTQDCGREPTNAFASNMPFPPNILHSYIPPPYVPGLGEVAGQSIQYCGPIPIQISMPSPLYFYPSPPVDPGYNTITYSERCQH